MNMRPYINGVLSLLFLANTPFLFAADTANPVKVESLSTEEVPYQAPIEDEKASPKNAAMETQYQLQVLQQDMQNLRGMVEDLAHQVKQLQSTQEDRYLEMDSRVQNLQKQILQGGAVGGTKPGSATGTGSGSGDIADVNQEEQIKSNSKNEKAMYETALDLIRKRQYDLAIQQLNAVITQFPNGDFTANAYYWLGEVYAAKPEPAYEKARQALAQVMTYFPKSRKVPDAAFKLGKVYFLMGDCERAEQTLKQVVKDYPDKSVAKLAGSYLRDKVHCKN